MRPIKLFMLWLAILTLLSASASAVEFHECTKFLGKDPHKYNDCISYSFSEATHRGEYHKASQWLASSRNGDKHTYNKLLTILMCGNHTNMANGSRPFQSQHRQSILRLTDELLRRGASFDAMPTFSIVTPLFCVSNRQDSAILDHVLTRIQATKQDLDSCPYEGIDPDYVPLFRTVINNDLASAKVLIKHGATPDFSVQFNETALKKALELRNVTMANWLLDIGASVHKRDDQNGCAGKSALDYALEIPVSVSGGTQLVERIRKLEKLPSSFRSRCAG